MLHCPSSRINLTNSDIANFERRFAAKQAAARLAQINQSEARLSPGPSRLASLTIVRNDSTARKRAQYSSQATVYNDADDELERIASRPLRASLSPPTIRTSDYDNERAAGGHYSSPADRYPPSTSSSRVRVPRRDGSLSHGHGSLSPPRVDGASERLLQPLAIHQTSWEPGPANTTSRSPRHTLRHQDFVLYEESDPVQAQIEAEHMHRWHTQNAFNARRSLLEPGPTQPTARRSPSRPVLDAARAPVLLPNLNPGAPAFVPRARFGSGTGGSEENSNGRVAMPRQGGRGSRVSSTQSSSNLRVRSSFERNSQQTYRVRDSHGTSIPPDIPVVRPSHSPQHRRRSRTSDQNASLPVISSIGERYPALRPPTSIPAPRRNSGSHRQVVFPRRVSSRQHLEYGETIHPSVGSSGDQRHSSTQSKTSSLAVPEVSSFIRGTSPAPSSNSRSAPNLLQAVLPSQLVHSRSGSLSWEHFVSQHDSNYRVPSVVSAASGASGSSDGRSQQSGHIHFEESMLSRGSPLDELLLDFGRLFPSDDRPRSVGRSFKQPPGSKNRVSLLTGDIFQQNSFHEQRILQDQEHVNSGRHPLKIANDSSFSDEDAVALSLALPSPNLPSSSPIASIPGHYPTSPASVQEREHLSPRSSTKDSADPPPQSSATRSHRSVSTLTPGSQPTATPRVTVYDDRKSPRTQPQTPADISRSTKQARSLANTMSKEEVGTAAGGLFSPVIPERRHHRPYTYPAGTPPSMADAAVMPARPGIVGGQVGRGSHLREEEQRGSGASENDVEENLAGLDADRRVWMQRREEGSLDVTPPREGRFERYLR